MGLRDKSREAGGSLVFLAVESGVALMAETWGWPVVALIASAGFGVLLWGWWPELGPMLKASTGSMSFFRNGGQSLSASMQQEKPARIWQTAAEWSVPVLVLGSIFAAVNYFSGASVTVFQPPPPVSQQRIFLRDGLSDLTAYYRHNTDAEADRLIAPKVGKWLAISGTVRNIEPNRLFGNLAVELSTRVFTGTPVFLEFSRRWNDRIGLMKAGEAISAYCQLRAASSIEVTLTNCELVL